MTGCPFIYSPVCASNGKSYDNYCLMDVYACEQKEELHIVHDGFCEGGENTCNFFYLFHIKIYILFHVF